MLIQFSVENFCTFREKQTLSMVVDSSFKRQDNHHVYLSGFSAVPEVHCQAAVFGENGAGKTSFINAMLYAQQFVSQAFSGSPDDKINTHPFLYHIDYLDKPTRFEVDFLVNDTLYGYSFAISPERVEEEHLVARPKKTGRLRQLFSRSFNHKTKSHEWYINPFYIKGERESWKSQTRPNALFLSTAVRLNCQSLLDVYRWLVTKPVFIPTNTRRYRDLSAKRLLEKNWRKKIMSYLRKLGVQLVDIEVKNIKLSETRKISSLPKSLPEDLQKDLIDESSYEINFVRLNNRDEVVSVALDEESNGTKALFDLAAPLLESLENGRTVVVDEFNTNLHPLVFHAIVSMFGDSKHNSKYAQLIFTTHDVTIPENDAINRDQVWLIEKGRDHAASLYSFSEFKTRYGTNFQKGYLQGRYGSIPTIL